MDAAPLSPPNLDAGATGVERSFEAGGRYEFHTLNDTSPYEDNARTVTKRIGSAGAPVLIAAAVVVVAVLRRRLGTCVAGDASAR